MPHPAFTDTVTRVRVTVDDWGEPSYDLDREYPARVESTSRTLVNDEGRTLQMMYDVYLQGDADLTVSDKLKIGDEQYTIHRLETLGGMGYSRMKIATV